MEITFRDYTHQDKLKLLELIKKLSAFGKTLDSMKRIQNAPGFAEKECDDLLIEVATQHGKIILAENRGRIVGFIAGVIREQSEKNALEIGRHVLGEVTDLFIEETYREQGIGTKMLTKMEHFFKEKSCDSMWVQLFAPNKNAHAVYERFGFVDRSIGMLKTI